MIYIMRHIEVVREKPEHIRKQVALGLAVAITAVIALLWLGISLSTGAFAIEETSFADAGSVFVAETPTAGTAGLAGAAAAIFGAPQAPAHIEIVNTNVHSTLEEAPEPTILPF